jgi:integrase/recombinase XerC
MSDNDRALMHVEPAPLARRGEQLAGPVAAWLDSKAGRSGSTRTRDSYAATLADARTTLGAVGLDLDSDPCAVALALQAWARSSKRGRELKPATVAQRLAVVSSFYDFAIRRGLVAGLTSNPADLVERPKVESYAEAQALDPAKVRQTLGELRRAAAGEGPAADLAARDLALLRVALTTGRRVAELAALRWRDLEVTGNGAGVTLTFRRAKGGKVMRDALAPSVAADLLAWLHRHYGAELGQLDKDAALWPALRHGGKDGRARVGAALKAEGLAEIVARRLDTHPHTLRHSFAHGMRKAGAKDSEVQARLGHSNLATTGRYLAQLDKADNPFAGQLADLFDGK